MKHGIKKIHSNKRNIFIKFILYLVLYYMFYIILYIAYNYIILHIYIYNNITKTTFLFPFYLFFNFDTLNVIPIFIIISCIEHI